MNLESQIKRAEGNIERRLNEHTQMAVMLERLAFLLGSLNLYGSGGKGGGAHVYINLAEARKARDDAVALLKKVNT
jgi:hypothetical protein